MLGQGRSELSEKVEKAHENCLQCAIQQKLMDLFDDVEDDETYTGEEVKQLIEDVWFIGEQAVDAGKFENITKWFVKMRGWDLIEEEYEEEEDEETK